MKNKMPAVIMVLVLGVSLLASCGKAGGGTENEKVPETSKATEISELSEDSENKQQPRYPHAYTAEPEMMEVNDQRQNIINDHYRTCYEVFVYSFFDSNEDGIGDLKGLISKLDYINDGNASTDDDLGCNEIRLMPVMPSPVYHKYDVSDYMDIDPEYGTIEDFETLVEECHNRKIYVLMDFVMDHTSLQHKWFQEAGSYLKALPEGEEPDTEECPYVGYYHFSAENQSGYCALEGTNWYYKAQDGMPVLDLENKAVREEFDAIVQFWLDKGVDGFCLDAVDAYAPESPESSMEILSWFTGMAKGKKKDVYLAGEAFGEASEYAAYYESGINSMFDLSFAGSSGYIAEVLNGKCEGGAMAYGEAIEKEKKEIAEYTKRYISAPFYVNHDLGRSAGYYTGEFDEDKIKMAQAMNLLMSGNAFLYYGEELGMPGSRSAENARTGMLWSASKLGKGMCAGPQTAEAQEEPVFGSIREQRTDPYSIYNYVKQVIKLRNIYPQISRGTTVYKEELSNENVCVLSKIYESTEMLMLFNISGEECSVDLSGYKLNGYGWKKYTVAGMLQTGEEAPGLEESEAVLPPYSVIMFK